MSENHRRGYHRNTTEKIIRLFRDYPDRRELLVVGQPQIGKTTIIENLLLHDYFKDKKKYVISGLSSRAWRDQTRDRLHRLAGIDCKVEHRDGLVKTKCLGNIHPEGNSLIIIDESHIAVSEDQTLDIFFELSGLRGRSDVHVIEISATPKSTRGWLLGRDQFVTTDGRLIVRVEEPENYFSPSRLFREGLVMEALSLDYGGSSQISQLLDNFSNTMGKYCIIRLPIQGKSAREIPYLMNKVSSLGSRIRTIHYYGGKDSLTYGNSMSTDSDINEVLSRRPEVPTVIFIKDTLNCSKTLHKEHIEFLYERIPKQPCYRTIIQGLLGRACGYIDSPDCPVNTKCKVYTDVESIREYETILHGYTESTAPVTNSAVSVPPTVSTRPALSIPWMVSSSPVVPPTMNTHSETSFPLKIIPSAVNTRSEVSSPPVVSSTVYTHSAVSFPLTSSSPTVNPVDSPPKATVNPVDSPPKATVKPVEGTRSEDFLLRIANATASSVERERPQYPERTQQAVENDTYSREMRNRDIYRDPSNDGMDNESSDEEIRYKVDCRDTPDTDESSDSVEKITRDKYTVGGMKRHSKSRETPNFTSEVFTRIKNSIPNRVEQGDRKYFERDVRTLIKHLKGLLQNDEETDDEETSPEDSESNSDF